MKEKKEIEFDKRKRAPWPKPGYRYGYLVVISRGMDTKDGRQRFWCRCDCGRRKLIRGDYLQNGRISSCGHRARGVTLMTEVPGYKCLETGEVFTEMKKALKFACLPPDYGRDFSRKVRFRQNPIGTHPKTGEPLHWEYVKVPGELKRRRVRDKRTYKRKKVVLLNTGDVFDSADEAARKFGVDADSIRHCCTNDIRSVGENEFGEPLVWMYYEDWVNEASPDE